MENEKTENASLPSGELSLALWPGRGITTSSASPSAADLAQASGSAPEPGVSPAESSSPNSSLSPTHLTLPLDAIEFDPGQPRQHAEHELGELAASLRQHGLLQPVVVVGWPDASQARTYRVVTGERRVRAARRLGWTEIDALVLGPGIPRFLLSVTENIQRKGLSRSERKHAFARVLDGCGGDKNAAAALLGVSLTTFYRTLAEAGDRYANWSPSGSLKRLEKAASRMPAEKRLAIASDLRDLAARLEQES